MKTYHSTMLNRSCFEPPGAIEKNCVGGVPQFVAHTMDEDHTNLRIRTPPPDDEVIDQDNTKKYSMRIAYFSRCVSSYAPLMFIGACITFYFIVITHV